MIGFIYNLCYSTSFFNSIINIFIFRYAALKHEIINLLTDQPEIIPQLLVQEKIKLPFSYLNFICISSNYSQNITLDWSFINYMRKHLEKVPTSGTWLAILKTLPFHYSYVFTLLSINLTDINIFD